jgi:hypothetical protein
MRPAHLQQAKCALLLLALVSRYDKTSSLYGYGNSQPLSDPTSSVRTRVRVHVYLAGTRVPSVPALYSGTLFHPRAVGSPVYTGTVTPKIPVKRTKPPPNICPSTRVLSPFIFLPPGAGFVAIRYCIFLYKIIVTSCLILCTK